MLNDFVGEVQRSLGYFTNTHRDAHVEYMVGLGNAFQLPGLQKFLAEKLQLEVRKPAKFARLDRRRGAQRPAVQREPADLRRRLRAGAAGARRRRGCTTNLLPPEIRMDRLIRAKKPWAVAAAAALLLGTGALALGSGLELKSVSDPSIEKGLDSAKSAGTAYSTGIEVQSEEDRGGRVPRKRSRRSSPVRRSG